MITDKTIARHKQRNKFIENNMLMVLFFNMISIYLIFTSDSETATEITKQINDYQPQNLMELLIYGVGPLGILIARLIEFCGGFILLFLSSAFLTFIQIGIYSSVIVSYYREIHDIDLLDEEEKEESEKERNIAEAVEINKKLNKIIK